MLLANNTIANFLEQSCQEISLSKHSRIFPVFHTKSSRMNYIASELVLQYLTRHGMNITIQTAKYETRSKYSRKHSDKWLQRELQLRTKNDLFNILVSDFKDQMISTTVLKSSKIKKEIKNENDNANDSSLFNIPSPASNNSKSGKNSDKKEKQWPIYLSTSSTPNDSPNSSKSSKILNIIEVSSDNQFYFNKNVVNENDNVQLNSPNSSINCNPNEKVASPLSNLADFECETGSENNSQPDKYSVSLASKFKTTSVTDKSRSPYFQQKKNKMEKSANSKNSSPVKERQVSFAEYSQSGSSPHKEKQSSSVNFDNKTNSIIGSPKTETENPLDKDQSTSSQIESNEDEKPKRRHSRESRRRVRLSKNMPPKAKPVSDADEYDIEFLHEVMNETKRSEIRKKFELYNEGKYGSDGKSPKSDQNSFKSCSHKQRDVQINDNQDQQFEKDCYNIVYSENSSDLDHNLEISNRFTGKRNDNEIIDSESENKNQTKKRIKKTKIAHNEIQENNPLLSLEENCFYFEKHPNDIKTESVGIEVNFKSDRQSSDLVDFLLMNEEEEEAQTKPNYYSFLATIFEAKNVIKTDLIKTCDPFCKIIVKDNDNNKDDKAMINLQTKVMNNTQNPQWNESFNFNIQNIENKSISIQIFDSDPIGDDSLLNSISFPLSRFVNKKEGIDEVLSLKSEKKIGILTDLHLFIKASPGSGLMTNMNSIVEEKIIDDFNSEEESDNVEIFNFDRSKSDENNNNENNNDQEEESQLEFVQSKNVIKEEEEENENHFNNENLEINLIEEEEEENENHFNNENLEEENQSENDVNNVQKEISLNNEEAQNEEIEEEEESQCDSDFCFDQELSFHEEDELEANNYAQVENKNESHEDEEESEDEMKPIGIDEESESETSDKKANQNDSEKSNESETISIDIDIDVKNE